MDVGSESGVIGQIPTRMVWIFIDDDRVGIPDPVADICVLPGCDAPIPSVKPKAGRTASGEMKDVTGAEAAREVPVFPRMIHVVAPIVGLSVTDPFIVSVNVRSVRVSGLVAEIMLLTTMLLTRALLRLRRRCTVRRIIGAAFSHWAVCRNVAASDIAMSGRRSAAVLMLASLRQGGHGNCEEQYG